MGKKETCINWRRIYRMLAEGYFMPPSEVNELTWYQLRMLTCDRRIIGLKEEKMPRGRR